MSSIASDTTPPASRRESFALQAHPPVHAARVPEQDGMRHTAGHERQWRAAFQQAAADDRRCAHRHSALLQPPRLWQRQQAEVRQPLLPSARVAGKPHRRLSHRPFLPRQRRLLAAAPWGLDLRFNATTYRRDSVVHSAWYLSCKAFAQQRGPGVGLLRPRPLRGTCRRTADPRRDGTRRVLPGPQLPLHHTGEDAPRGTATPPALAERRRGCSVTARLIDPSAGGSGKSDRRHSRRAAVHGARPDRSARLSRTACRSRTPPMSKDPRPRTARHPCNRTAAA